MAAAGRDQAVLDTSVLLNFLKVDRLDLLAQHPRYRFLVTDHVRVEITQHYPDQLARLEAALIAREFDEIQVTDPTELQVFGQLHGAKRLGAGECSAIAVAARRGLSLAVDDKRARKEARALSSKMVFLNTESLMLSLIHEGVIDVTTADSIKLEWEQTHRFKLSFGSFAERIWRASNPRRPVHYRECKSCHCNGVVMGAHRLVFITMGSHKRLCDGRAGARLWCSEIEVARQGRRRTSYASRCIRFETPGCFRADSIACPSRNLSTCQSPLATDLFPPLLWRPEIQVTSWDRHCTPLEAGDRVPGCCSGHSTCQHRIPAENHRESCQPTGQLLWS